MKESPRSHSLVSIKLRMAAGYNCEDRIFEFEGFVRDRLGIDLDVKKIDESDPSSVNICRFFLKGNCTKGSGCAFKHGRPDKSVVCKHWLRGLCKKGENCEFLHEYNLKKMPECWFFSKYGECSNHECMYLHIDPNSKVKECAWYARGFCKHGPNCRNRHVRMVACSLFITGFCPQGPNCPLAHPKWELTPAMLSSTNYL